MKELPIDFLTKNLNDPTTFLEAFNVTAEEVIDSLQNTPEEDPCWQTRFPFIDTFAMICSGLTCDKCPFNTRESAIAWLKLSDK